jgi:lytic murein transglycosylase
MRDFPRFLLRLTKRQCAVMIAVAAFSFPASAQTKADTEAKFQGWIQQTIAPLARKAGVSDATFQSAMNGVALDWDIPGLVPPGSKGGTPKEQQQAEFRAPANYFNPKSIATLVSGGRARLATHAATLRAVEQKYGVPGSIILAIWGRESGFGAAKIPHNVFRVLATKGFMSTRPELFQTELVAALQIAESGSVPLEKLRSSWAGALGQPQFLPSSYIKYAVDFDGDGTKDIWNSVPDTLASIANYLSAFGWQAGREWGYEVVLPDSVSCAMEGPDKLQKISNWENDGVIRVNGSPFPGNEIQKPASLVLPAGRLGPEFLVTPNFYTLKNYNQSDLYALFVGHVADRITGKDAGFVNAWQPVDSLQRSQVVTIQKGLDSFGYKVGGTNGLAGFKTRRSIGEWQRKRDLVETCFPSKELLNLLR